LSNRGYSANVIATLLSGKSREIAEMSASGYEVYRPREGLGTEEDIPKVQVAGDISAREIAAMFRSMLGLKDRHHEVNVLEEGNDYIFILRNGNSTKGLIVKSVPKSAPMVNSLEIVAQSIMRDESWYTLGAYFIRTNEFQRAIAVADEAIQTGDDLTWAFILRCDAYQAVESGEPDADLAFDAGLLSDSALEANAAVDACRRAVTEAVAVGEDDQLFAAHANLAISLLDRYYLKSDEVPSAKADLKEADSEFRKAMTFRQDSPAAHCYWSDVLKRLNQDGPAKLEKDKSNQLERFMFWWKHIRH